MWCLGTYIALHFVAWLLYEKQALFTAETSAAVIACAAQIVVGISDAISQRWRGNNALGQSAKTSKLFYSGSGGLRAARVTLAVTAIGTNVQMAFVSPLPVAVDSTTSCRVCIIRWAEWTALSTYMMFMVELLDAKTWDVAARRAVLQFLCCGMGMLLPAASGAIWWLLLCLALTIFSSSMARLYTKRREYERSAKAAAAAKQRAAKQGHHRHGRLKDAADAVKWTREDELRGTYQLHLWCGLVWSSFVANYFVSWFLLTDVFAGLVGAPPIRPHDTPDWRTMWPLTTNGCLDVISKVFFAKIIVESYAPLFDPLQQQVKVLNIVVENIAQNMGVIWDSSKDALLVETRFVPDRAGAAAGAASDRGGGGGGGELTELTASSFNVSPSIVPMLGLPSTMELGPNARSELGAELIRNHAGLKQLVDTAWEEHRRHDERVETHVSLPHATGGAALECDVCVTKYRFGPSRAVVVVLRDATAKSDLVALRREMFAKEERFKQEMVAKEKRFKMEREQDAEWVASLLQQQDAEHAPPEEEAPHTAKEKDV